MRAGQRRPTAASASDAEPTVRSPAPAKRIYPDGSEVARSYTARGQLHTLAVDLTTIDTRTYDDGGRILSSSYNNGVSELRSYNGDNTLASINYSGAPIGDFSYTWTPTRTRPANRSVG